MKKLSILAALTALALAACVTNKASVKAAEPGDDAAANVTGPGSTPPPDAGANTAGPSGKPKPTANEVSNPKAK